MHSIIIIISDLCSLNCSHEREIIIIRLPFLVIIIRAASDTTSIRSSRVSFGL